MEIMTCCSKLHGGEDETSRDETRQTCRGSQTRCADFNLEAPSPLGELRMSLSPLMVARATINGQPLWRRERGLEDSPCLSPFKPGRDAEAFPSLIKHDCFEWTKDPGYDAFDPILKGAWSWVGRVRVFHGFLVHHKGQKIGILDECFVTLRTGSAKPGSVRKPMSPG